MAAGAGRRRLYLFGGLLLLGLLLLGCGSMIWMPGRSFAGAAAPLATHEQTLRQRLERHVRQLADKIGPRHVGRPEALEQAARYIEAQLQALGLKVNRQPYKVGRQRVYNIEAVLPGGALTDQIVVLGAHYDSWAGTPGANDNGSGVAALLEIARLLTGRSLPRTVRLVAFVNEEPPYFQTERMGSLVYARACKERGDRVTAMLSLETMGFYSDEPGSQRYPLPLRLVYPDRGNFVAFVGNLGSMGLVRRAVGSFRRHTDFPSEGAALPGWIPGVGWSDHWSFWQAGYAAVMVTDTAPFRYGQYHTMQDVPSRLVYPRFARVVAGVARVAAELAGEEGAL